MIKRPLEASKPSSQEPVSDRGQWPSQADGAEVERARNGDLDAFTALLKKNDAVMRSAGWRILGNQDALDDALQDAYLKAFRKLGSLRSNDGFRSWLYRTVETTCLDMVRRESLRRHDNVEELRGLPSIVTDPGDIAADRQELYKLLDQLAPEHREVFVLSAGVGMSHQEIAEYLSIAVGTVGSRLSRARRAVENLHEVTE